MGREAVNVSIFGMSSESFSIFLVHCASASASACVWAVVALTLPTFLASV